MLDLALLLLWPTDGPRWVLSELAPSEGYRIEMPGDPIPLPADADGDGVNELLLADAPGDWFAGRLRVVSPITGQVLHEHETPLEWGEHFCTFPLSDLDRGGEAETALGFRQVDDSTSRTIALLDGEDGGLTFLRTVASQRPTDFHGFIVGVEGDLDLDGVDELRITTRNAEDGAQAEHTGWTEWVVSPVGGALVEQREHAGPDAPVGCSWTLDVDLDGVADGWRWEEPWGWLSLFSGRTGKRLLEAERPESLNVSSGYPSMDALAGDLDGDSVPDWIAGDGEHNRDVLPIGWREDAGRVEIYSGRSGCILLSIQGADRHEGWGCRVGAAGDVNRDGIDDVFVGTDHGLWVLYGSRPGFWW